ncbi:hypothetical protein LB505_002549 [Fusarium chuoi]|nr:hypothetical protein LB505_002549 [Fusarium chuoi]
MEDDRPQTAEALRASLFGGPGGSSIGGIDDNASSLFSGNDNESHRGSLDMGIRPAMANKEGEKPSLSSLVRLHESVFSLMTICLAITTKISLTTVIQMTGHHLTTKMKCMKQHQEILDWQKPSLPSRTTSIAWWRRKRLWNR